MAGNPSFYEVLGLENFSTWPEVEGRYRRLVAEQASGPVQTGYDIAFACLERGKAEYDAYLRARLAIQPASG